AQHVFGALHSAPGFHAASIRVPILELGRPDVPWRSLDLIRSLRLAPRSWIEVTAVEHLDFISKAMIANAVGIEASERQLRAYREVITEVRRFLSRTLIDPDSRPSDVSSTAAAGTLLHGMVLPGESEAPSRNEYRSLLRDPASAPEAINSYRSFALELNGMQLLKSSDFAFAAESHLPERPSVARDIFKLWAEVFPQDDRAWVGLGDTWSLLGATTQARSAYQKALTIRPDAVFARLALASLQRGESEAGQVATSSQKPHKHWDRLTYLPIPAGRFRMGCVADDPECETHEKPARQVELTRDYWMSQSEVTIAAFRRFVEETGYVPSSELGDSGPRGRMYIDPPGEWRWIPGLSWKRPLDPAAEGNPDWPVVQVTLRDARSYCAWAGGRLPTEAEWERAARGGKEGQRHLWGPEPPEASGRSKPLNGPDQRTAARFPTMATWDSYDDGFATVAPVMSFTANGYGLFDMTGNVYEYTGTYYAPDSYARQSSRDPNGPSEERDGIVARGGAWGYAPSHQRLSWRGYFSATSDFWTATLGFRCVLDAAPG
ncbi:MAG: SUMF1/EgtB/PvdO family nonheme iron enzyme, partial [Pseudomonadota bacterium]